MGTFLLILIIVSLVVLGVMYFVGREEHIEEDPLPMWWYQSFLPGCIVMTKPETDFSIHQHWGWFSKWRGNFTYFLVTDHWTEQVDPKWIFEVAPSQTAIEARTKVRMLRAK
jgi:hypothetical protein